MLSIKFCISNNDNKNVTFEQWNSFFCFLFNCIECDARASHWLVIIRSDGAEKYYYNLLIILLMVNGLNCCIKQKSINILLLYIIQCYIHSLWQYNYDMKYNIHARKVVLITRNADVIAPVNILWAGGGRDSCKLLSLVWRAERTAGLHEFVIMRFYLLSW